MAFYCASHQSLMRFISEDVVLSAKPEATVNMHADLDSHGRHTIWITVRQVVLFRFVSFPPPPLTQAAAVKLIPDMCGLVYKATCKCVYMATVLWQRVCCCDYICEPRASDFIASTRKLSSLHSVSCL